MIGVKISKRMTDSASRFFDSRFLDRRSLLIWDAWREWTFHRKRGTRTISSERRAWIVGYSWRESWIVNWVWRSEIRTVRSRRRDWTWTDFGELSWSWLLWLLLSLFLSWCSLIRHSEILLNPLWCLLFFYDQFLRETRIVFRRRSCSSLESNQSQTT